MQITGVTNGIASLVIHPPSGVTNGVYDLESTSNAASSGNGIPHRPRPDQSFRSQRHQCAVGLLPPRPAQRPRRERQPRHQFLLTFVGLCTNYNALSLFISSPATAAGTVTVLNQLNGPNVIVLNCGDTNVNGDYVLSNITVNPGVYSLDGYTASNAYVKVPYLIFFDDNDFDGRGWALADSGTTTVDFIGNGPGETNLNDVVWSFKHDPVSTNPPTTVCPQLPLTMSFSVAPGTITNIQIPLDVITSSSYDTIGSNGISS